VCRKHVAHRPGTNVFPPLGATAFGHDPVPLQQALRHLDRAFRNFFEQRAHYPTFKKKRGKQAATFASTAFSWDAATRTLKLAKMDESLAIRWSRAFTGTPTTVTVSRDSAGRYFISFLVEEAIATLPSATTSIGLDLGLKDLAVLSTGEKIPNPKHLAHSVKRLQKAQQALARKRRGSKNREKAQLKVAREHASCTRSPADR
jgi:putative transposase